ncbi:ParB N-terminal domain-containing protein [Patescibacteria group bacterium]|nr:ParB N-terminal domain-containing protein [Patescibacteria group bacterium]
MNKKKLVPLEWHVEKLIVKDLKTWKENPRTITKESLEKLKNRIIQRGMHDVVKIDTDRTILSGNQRRDVLINLGVKEVIVLVPNRSLTKDERTKVALESNTNDGEWDFDELKSFDLDTLVDIGFDENQLVGIWDEHLEVIDDDFDEVEELKKIKETDIKLGDMFKLGKHTLICGDALDPNVVNRLMGDAKADFVDDDLPFNIGLSYDKGVGNKSSYGGTTDDNKTDEEYRIFVKTIMQNALSVSKPDCHYIFWCDERYVWLFQTLYKELGIDSKRLLIWLKNNSSPTPTVAFNKVTEFAIYGTRGKVYLSKNVNNLHEITNKEFTTGNNLSEEILDQLNIWMVKRLPSNQYSHPTQKNPELHNKALRRCTRSGDVVLDLTAGSGSILSACEQLNRVAYLCELEPIFCQVIINRFLAQTGVKAVKIEHEKG